MMDVGFIPMKLFNERPLAMEPMPGHVMLHFRGKLERKQQMVGWAKRWLR
jgi:hypothetical protein